MEKSKYTDNLDINDTIVLEFKGQVLGVKISSYLCFCHKLMMNWKVCECWFS